MITDKGLEKTYVIRLWERVEEDGSNKFVLGFYFADMVPVRTVLEAGDIPGLVDEMLQRTQIRIDPRLDYISTIERARTNPLEGFANQPTSGQRLLEFHRIYAEKTNQQQTLKPT